MNDWKPASIEDLEFKYISKVEAEVQGEEVHLYTSYGEHYKMHHAQDCCETVYLADITGDIEDLQNCLVLIAEEATQVGDGSNEDDSYGSHTWTFYKFQTSKGAVTLRWYGESNGYYSESVDFVKEVPDDTAVC